MIGQAFRVTCAQCRTLHLGPDREQAIERAKLHVESKGHVVAVHEITQPERGDGS